MLPPLLTLHDILIQFIAPLKQFLKNPERLVGRNSLKLTAEVERLSLSDLELFASPHPSPNGYEQYPFLLLSNGKAAIK